MSSNKVRLFKELDALTVGSIFFRACSVAYRDMLPAEVLNEYCLAGKIRHQQRRVASGRECVLVAECDGVVVGHAEYEPDLMSTNNVELNGLYVDPSYWGTGIGMTLLKEVFSRASGEDFCCVSLWVFEENYRARRFFEKAGFIFDKRREVEDSLAARGFEAYGLRYVHML